MKSIINFSIHIVQYNAVKKINLTKSPGTYICTDLVPEYSGLKGKPVQIRCYPRSC